MKKKIFTKSVLVLIIPVLYFVFFGAFSRNEKAINTNSGSAATIYSDTTKFVNMIQNMDWVHCDTIWIGKHLNDYKELGYNSVHVYPSDNDEYGKFPDTLNPHQKAQNDALIHSVDSSGLKFFYEHVFLSYLCYAQRLVYEVPLSGVATNDGFCFQNTSVNVSLDSGRTVLHSTPSSNHQETLLCDSICENLQHSDFFGRQHDDTLWYLKPMVRADLAGIHDTTPIFKLKIMNFAGEEDTSIIVKAFNFRKDTVYNNNYTDKFYAVSTSIDLTVSGNKTNGLNKGKDTPGTYLKQCKVDFKIYTYGYVDFYFDKLTVDDDYAHKLLDVKLYDDILQNSLQNIGNNPELYSYYMDEVAPSQLPCIKYVMDKISAYPNIKFMVSESNWMATNVMRSTNHGHSLTLNALHPRILNVFAYEFWGDNTGYTYIPAFALNNDSVETKLPTDWRTQNYNTYNNYIQNVILGSSTASSGYCIHEPGTFIYQVCLAKQNIKDNSSNTMLYITPQMQGEMCIDSSSGNLISVREPLNEEIEAQTMCALSHGAQGLVGYIFQTTIDLLNPYAEMSHVFGLYGKPNDTLHIGEYRRFKNHYGQNKWNFIKKMNGKINSWIQTLDKVSWLEGYSVHSESIQTTYISDIQSIHRDITGSFSDGPTCPNCDAVKYWEIGIFNPIDNNDRSKYFLMTNRRCVPEIDSINEGDLRQLKIKFAPSQLTGFNNWKLINVQNDSFLTTFDKNTTNYIHAGIFQPGEGKFFRIVPVMVEGGTFVCNEYVTASVGSFDCKGNITNNGYELEIEKGVTINFKDNVGINFSHSNFMCGMAGGNTNNVFLKGSGNEQWKEY